MTWKSFSSQVEKCEDAGGWVTVAVPQSCVPPKELITGHFGYVPVTARISSSEWDTSFMPVGDGSYFMALPKKIRTKQNIEVGDNPTIEFCLRNR